MLESDFSRIPELRTARLIIRELRKEDAANLFIMRRDPVVMEFIGSRISTCIEDVDELIEQKFRDRRNNEEITLGLTLHGDDTLIGTIGFYRLQPEHFRGEIGYILGKPHWGQGLMSEAVAAALDLAFNTLGFHSIQAVTDPGNERSRALLIRNGFKQQGLFKENFYWDGKFYDSAVFSKLASEHGS